MAGLFNDWYDYINPYRYAQQGVRNAEKVGEGVSDYFMGPTRAGRRQARAAERGVEVQEELGQKAIDTQKPWLETGEKHLKSLSDMVDKDAFDVDPGSFESRSFGNRSFESRSFTPEKFNFNFEADPGYQFRMDQGMKAIERSAASRGGLRSGGVLKSLADYGQGLASQEYGNAYNRAYGAFADKRNFDYGNFADQYNRDYGNFTDQYNRDYGQFSDDYNRRVNRMGNRYNQLANMAGMGQTAANQVSGFNMQQGQNMANAYYNQGNAQANRDMSMQNTVNPWFNMAAQGFGAYYGAKNGANK